MIVASERIRGQLNAVLARKQGNRTKAKRERHHGFSQPRARQPPKTKTKKVKQPSVRRQSSYYQESHHFAPVVEPRRAPSPKSVVITPQIKTLLTEEINKLDGDHVETVVDIIRMHNPDLVHESGEVELEIDQLNDNALRALYQFVSQIRGIVPEQTHGLHYNQRTFCHFETNSI
jgi:hypothetical protein